MKKENEYRWETNRDEELKIVTNSLQRIIDRGIHREDLEDCEFYVLFKEDIINILKLRIDSEKEMLESQNYEDDIKETSERIHYLEEAINCLNKALSNNR